ncbi:hypothetical protein GCM10011371_08470 [Novosphingobium marinum]|nr:hypothetical protein GCM10011371_08470 [Novosphingobium marinum]
MGGPGNLTYPRHKVYPHPDYSIRADRLRPPPEGFREAYLEEGWDCHPDFQCGWKTFARWIDQCGGDELRAARAEVVRTRGRRLRGCVGTDQKTDSRWYDQRSKRIPGY